MDLRIGDEVSVLDDDLTGVIIHIFNDIITIETDDEFLLEFSKNQLIKIGDHGQLMSRHSWNSEIKDEDLRKPVKPLKKGAKTKKDRTVFEVDLHIDKLLPTSKGMSTFDILDFQVETAKRQFEFAIRKKIQRVVFIHGVGEGKLRLELEYLIKRYDGVTFSDGDYQKYGVGAMEVHIPQTTFRL